MSFQSDSAVAEAAMRVAFIYWFGLTPAAASVLTTLYILRGECITTSDLAVAERTTKSSIFQRIHEARKALNAEALDFVPLEGYRLTDEGMAECRAVLWQMGEELRRAS